MIQLDNYFFEITDYDEHEENINSYQRSRMGKLFIDYSSPFFKTFEIEIEGVNKANHNNLLYLVHLSFSEEDGITFMNPEGDIYTVRILPDGYSYEPAGKGNKDVWDWSLTLGEVGLHG